MTMESDASPSQGGIPPKRSSVRPALASRRGVTFRTPGAAASRRGRI